MRVAVNLNFTDGELRRYAADVGRRWILTAIHEGIGHLSVAKIDPNILATFLDAIGNRIKPAAAAVGVPPDFQATSQPGPRPAAVPNECTYLGATPFSDEAWVCHVCSTYNGVHRTICRRRECGHVRCDHVEAGNAVDAEYPEPTQA